MTAGTRAVTIAAALLCASGAITPAYAQYFGQNKVQYKQLDFSTLDTAHFRIYFYPEEAAAARDVARMAERWHDRLSQFLGHALTGKQPVILYASHPDFEQTNVVEGLIGEGTGGVTEGLRRRIVLPLAASLAETDHVLGHELVHAFQYDILDPRVAGTTPLWFIEGMAEYLSLGARSPQTAMWMRDAILEDRFPDIDDLNDPDYFPYRFGHALWAYLGGRFGDQVVPNALGALSDTRGDAVGALTVATGVEAKQLAADWKASVAATYNVAPRPESARDDDARERRAEAPGGLVVGGDDEGRVNLAPSLSPDGKHLAFLSERGRLSLDLYLADASTGHVIRRLISTATDPHFDSLQFLTSAGAFSPDGRRIALATVRRARPVLAILDVESGDIQREYQLESLGEIFQPTWSPDGSQIAFSAQAGGRTDLFVMTLANGSLRQLTDDAFADLQPAWSPDGSTIAFVTDRFTASFDRLVHGRYELATIAPQGGAPASMGIPAPDGTNQYTPQWSDGGRTLLFVSDASGRPEVYRWSGGALTQITDVTTGVSGFTPLTPALSAAVNTDRAAFAVFRDGGFEIHVADAATMPAVSATSSPGALAALPPVDRASDGVRRLVATSTSPVRAPEITAPQDYSPHLELIAAGNQVGVASSGRFGTYVGGGIALYFSDVLNNHQLATSFSVNGTLRDIGGGAEYVNRTHRWNWGAYAQQSPFVTGSIGATIDGDEYVEETLRERETYTSLGAIVAYPFSRASRAEFSGGLTRIGFRNELEQRRYSLITGELIDRSEDVLPSPGALHLATASAALVRDTGIFGATGPILGQRARLEAQPVFGDLRFTNVIADVRKYVMPVRPITFAAKAVHFGRYGSDSEDSRLAPLFLGDPEFIRGYSIDSFSVNDCVPVDGSACPEFDRLLGSRVFVMNAEVRAPLVGLFRGDLSYGALPIDIFGFFDTGVAWTSAEGPTADGRRFVRSAGAGLRANAFGFAVLELAMARPFDRASSGWVFVFNLRPGF
jgi:hypothetical protein